MNTKNEPNNKIQDRLGGGRANNRIIGTPTPMSQVILAARTLQKFITPAELETIGNAVRGEEGDANSCAVIDWMCNTIAVKPNQNNVLFESGGSNYLDSWS